MSDTIITVIDKIPMTYKPILFTTYEEIIKYNLTITYEDRSTKTVELVQGDKERPYRVVFKKNGELITVTGIPKIYKITGDNVCCDFVNRILESDDLLIEMDCSSEYECKKARFYLKDIRDIRDLVLEPLEEEKSYDHNPYPIYLNGYTCETKIKCVVDENFKIILTPQVTKLGVPLTQNEYSDFKIFFESGISHSILEDGTISLLVSESLLDTEIRVILRYFINEIEHPVFDEFIIIPTLEVEEPEDDEEATGTSLRRAVTTQDMQYLGDGLKPSLGNDLTPGFKPYKYYTEK